MRLLVPQEYLATPEWLLGCGSLDGQAKPHPLATMKIHCWLQGPLPRHLLTCTAELCEPLLPGCHHRHDPPLWSAHLHHAQLLASLWKAHADPGQALPGHALQ